MKQLEGKIVVEFDLEEASVLGNYIQWEMSYDSMPERVYDLLKELGSLIIATNDQD